MTTDEGGTDDGSYGWTVTVAATGRRWAAAAVLPRLGETSGLGGEKGEVGACGS